MNRMIGGLTVAESYEIPDPDLIPVSNGRVSEC